VDPGGREGALAPEARALWARFLLALVFVYGLLATPAAAGRTCSLMAWSKRRRLPLDTAQPGYLRLSGIAAPDKPSVTEHGKAPEEQRRRAAAAALQYQRPSDSDRLELERDDWPPIIPGIETSAMGQADARAGRKAVLAALECIAGTAAAAA
jgi:hypothetical protein